VKCERCEKQFKSGEAYKKEVVFRGGYAELIGYHWNCYKIVEEIEKRLEINCNY